MRILSLILSVALPTGGWAGCPPAPDHSLALDRLLSAVQKAQSESEARALSHEMWQYWTDAPDAHAQAILDRGMERRAAFDFLGALQEFDMLIDYCPSYAEGFNQRAFVHFLRQDYHAALLDLEKALDIAPKHVAAMSGRALSLVGLDRRVEARLALQEALTLNPWLPERHLLGSGGPLDPGGVDL